MRYLYGESDEKFVKATTKRVEEKTLANFNFEPNSLIESKQFVKEFDETDVPIVFKCTPDTLLNICVKIVDEFPMPKVYTWTIEDICKWLRGIGYRQYQNTFRENLINGHSLLLLDASALSAMNIRDFKQIKDLSRHIRSLFYFEMTKFARSLTLYPEFHCEIYKLFRTKTGAKYDVRPSELWRRMQLIRQKEPNYSHWQILERWLNFDKDPKYKELVGSAHRFNLYTCNAAQLKTPAIATQLKTCNCVPPCECFYSELDRRAPWRLKCLPHLMPDTEFVEVCERCISPCTCRWSAKKYQIRRVLRHLQEELPYKYGGIYAQIRYREYEKMWRRSSLLT